MEIINFAYYVEWYELTSGDGNPWRTCMTLTYWPRAKLQWCPVIDKVSCGQDCQQPHGMVSLPWPDWKCAALSTCKGIIYNPCKSLYMSLLIFLCLPFSSKGMIMALCGRSRIGIESALLGEPYLIHKLPLFQEKAQQNCLFWKEKFTSFPLFHYSSWSTAGRIGGSSPHHHVLCTWV